MSAIESRVVQLKFEAEQFAAGVKSTLAQLAQLKEGLKLEGAKQGLDEVSNAASRFSLDNMKSHLSDVGAKFTAMQVAAVTALSNIVNRAVDAGLQLAKSLTIEPLTSGFQEYETNLNSIQTIMANTGLKGSEGLKTVTGALDVLNTYSDQTIYNFSEMARNIGTFTAAGVKLDVATSAIKGIANLAAVSGSNAEQASGAMYQLSQALAAGKVTLEDWNSVVNAGMGGKVFQDSLIETARVHGVEVDAIIKKQGSFRNSLEKGWITSEILTETLSKFTGELSAEQLKSMGYTEEQAQGILEMGKTAVDAATKVKTMTQFMGTMKEQLGSGWAKTWQIVFGDFDEAKDSFTNASNAIGNIIQGASDARNDLLQGWKDLGGRTALIDGISNAFSALLSFIRPIKDAFQQIFPPATAQQLYNITVAIRDFMANLKLGDEAANDLKRTFAGLFAIFGILWDFIKAGVGFLGQLFGKLGEGSGGFLKFTGSIGDFLVSVREAIQQGQFFTKFFDGLSKVLSYPLALIEKLSNYLKKLFGSFDTGAATQAVENVTEKLEPLAAIGDKTAGVWEKVLSKIRSMMQKLSTVVDKIVDLSRRAADAIRNLFSGLNFDTVLAGLNTGLFAGVVLLLKNFLGNFSFFGSNGGFLEGITDAIEGLTGTLNGMQHALNASALLLIAAAIGILVLSLAKLAQIDEAGLKRGATAIGAVMAELVATFVAFNKLSTTGSAIKIGIMATGLILLAGAIKILAGAVEQLSSLSVKELQKGLIGVATLMITLVAAVNRLDTNTSGIIRTAASMILLGTAVRILVNSVEELGQLGWEELAKGLVGVGVLLGSLALFTRLVEADKGGITQGLGLILLATSLKILASAVGDFVQYNWEELGRGMAAIAAGVLVISAAMRLLPEGSILKAAGFAIIAYSLKTIADGVEEMSKLSWAEIGRGLTVMAGALAAIALSIAFLPPSTLLSAAAILIVASALGMIQEALAKMGAMSWEEIGKGLTVMAASLILIAGAVFVMQTAIAGAAAIIIVALALNMLVPVMEAFAGMSWEEILKGLAGLAGVFIILGLAGYVLGPLAPAIAALAISIALLGVAVLAAGLGVLAFATGLAILATAGAAATAAIVGIVSGLVGLIPYVLEQIGLGLIAFAKVISVSGPIIVEALVTVLDSLLDAIIKVTPKLVDTFLMLLDKLLLVLVEAIPKMVDAGGKLIIGILKGIANNIGGIVTAATDVVVNFIDGIGRNLPRVIDSAINLVISFVNGLADGIRNNQGRMNDAGVNLARAMVDGVISGIKRFVSGAVDAAVNMAKEMFNAAKSALGINSPSKEFIWIASQMVQGLVYGLNDQSKYSARAAAEVGDESVDAIAKSLSGLSKALGSDLIDFNPTISPVLDLSNVRKNAGELQDLFGTSSLDMSQYYAKATLTSSEYEDSREESGAGSRAGDTYNYTQNNTSPKALSTAEIYRQTKNVISRGRANAG